MNAQNLGRLRTSAPLLSVALGALLLTACDDDPVAPPEPIDLTLDFVAEVNGAAFACGQSYAGIGTAGTEITPVDFRLYVHDVTLVDANGGETPVELDQDGVWQHENLALLDFENGSGPCVNGTAATNTSVRGVADGGDYTAVKFTLGVPFELNHIDQTTAPAPLDLSAMFWSWNGGYKFARIDHTSAARPTGWNVHLGSTGCTPGGGPTVVPTTCANENRIEVTLDMDPETGVVVADYGALLAAADVSVNVAGAPGCMSFPGDPDCPPVMNAFGLDYEGSVSSGQLFFSAR